MNILIKRSHGLGSTILTTPIVRHLRQTLKDRCSIYIQSPHKNAYYNNPDYNGFHDYDIVYDHIFDFDGVWESNPAEHPLDAYLEHCYLTNDVFMGPLDSKQIVYKYTRTPYAVGWDWNRTIAIHAAAPTAPRTLPRSFWELLIDELIDEGFIVLQLGNEAQDHTFFADQYCYSLMNRPLNEFVWAISKARAFVCSDSYLLHFAGATNTPIVPIFTSTKAECRVPWRNGYYGWGCHPVSANIQCHGCLTYVNRPVTDICLREDNICTHIIHPIEVLGKILSIVSADVGQT